jgi:hypothetical protein
MAVGSLCSWGFGRAMEEGAIRVLFSGVDFSPCRSWPTKGGTHISLLGRPALDVNAPVHA